MKVFWFTLIFGALILSSFVFYTDPASRWRDAPYPFSRNLSPDELRLTPNNFDERSVKLSQLKFIDPPEILLFGDSRVRIVGSRFFNSEKRVFNLGVSGASIEDDLSLWQAAKELKKIPQYAIVFLDYWQFDEKLHKNYIHGDEIDRYLHNFLVENQISQPEITKTLSHSGEKQSLFSLIATKANHSLNKLRYNFQVLKDVLSYPMVRESFLIVKNEGFFGRRTEEKIILIRDKKPEEEGLLQDGSVLFSDSDLRVKTSEELQAKVTRYLSRDEHNIGHWIFDQSAQHRFEKFVQDLQKNHVRVIVIIPPLFPSIFRLMAEKKSFEKITVQEIKNDLKVTLCNATDPTLPGCVEEDFMDATHMQRRCVQKTLAYCLKQKPWSALLRAN